MPPDFNPAAWLNYAKWAVIAYLLFYGAMAFGLSLLAARVRQRSAWLAWFPVLNYYLMCRLAGASLLLILPALIPFLNLIVFAYLGAVMAKRVGRSPALGVLFGVPVLGNLVPLLLGAGGRTAAESAEPPPVRPPLVTALIHAGVALSLVALTGAGFIAASRMSRAPAATAAQATATLPARLAGTFTEFPIDTATDNPARPTQVVSESYAEPAGGESRGGGQISSQQLPPWIPLASLPTLAENATSAEYLTAGAGAKVNVVTLSMRDSHNGELTLPTRQQLAEIAPDATVTGLELSTPGNVTYRGFRVSTALAVYFALRRGDTNTAILISAQEVAGMAVAERLARNVGNGQGLLEEEQYRGAFSRLPPPPPGTSVQMVRTITQADIIAEVAKLDAAMANNRQDPEMARFAELLPLVKTVVPRSISIAGYAAGMDSNDGFIAGVAGYTSGSNAWTAMQALRTLQTFLPPGLPVAVTTIDVGGSTAFAVDAVDNGKPFGAILLRRGSSIAALTGVNTTSQALRPWAEGYAREK
ncbi:MAG: hypothetical protein JNG82_06940 [Opitutaceae bacterium]|jgi:hypothetical protein|nr:hypothetical protein [Opitutaceae bacterium]